MQFESSNIGSQAADRIMTMIVAGNLPDGSRVNEVHLSEALGISRTPLREGLARLVTTGVVTAEPRRGFFVAPMSVDEFEQLYDIRPILDPEALRLSGIPTERSLGRLDKLNDKMIAAKTASQAIDIDDKWHLELLKKCPNQVLLGLIKQIIFRTRRYEHALFRETKNVHNASNDHALILSALRGGDLPGACELLKRNMQSGKKPILEWLKKRATN